MILENIRKAMVVRSPLSVIAGRLLFALLAAALLPAIPLSAAATKTVVIIAGRKSHGPEGNRMHDYPWSAKLLKVMFDNSNVRDQVRVEYFRDGWPKDETALSNANTLVVISDGRDGDLYSDALHLESPERVAFVDQLMKRGCGLVTFHFSTFAPDKYAREILEWNGAYFDWEENGVRKWYSAIKTLDAEVRLASPSHPILRGVAPFRMKEEFYYNLRFGENDPRLTPLLTVPGLDGRQADGNTVAWAVQRRDGGRGFGTTCGHYYDNWKKPEFRKVMLNAIAWSAGLEVPEGGVDARYFEHDEISRALDGVSGVDRAVADDTPIRVLLFAGNDAHKWHNWEQTTPAIQGVLERDSRMRVDVSHDIQDLGRKRLKEYDVIVQNFVNWHDPRPLDEQSKMAFTNFVQGGGGLVLIHFANGAFHFSLPEAASSDWPEYRNMVRRVWNHQASDDTPASSHDSFGQFTVNVVSKSLLTAGLSSFGIMDELYFNQQGTEPIEPLITAVSRVTKREEPLAWSYSYGSGRVFQTLLGHGVKSYEPFEAREILRRAVAWAAQRKITVTERYDDPDRAKEVGK